MTTIEKVRQTFSALRRELGARQITLPKGTDGPIKFCFPGAKYAALIHYHEAPFGGVWRIDVPVAAQSDWPEGLPFYLLHEHADWVFARIELRGEGIAIEHPLLDDTSPDKLAAIVLAPADTALSLRRDLERAGALTIPPDEEAA